MESATTEVHLTLCAYDSVGPSRRTTYPTLLDDAERARLSRLHHAEHRRRFVIARALVRVALSRRRRVAPTAWRFAATAHGRPEIVAPEEAADLRFSLTHTGSILLCAVAVGTPVGIDVESLATCGDVEALAERHFARPEVVELARMSPDRRRLRFLELWTLKEAYVKARGLGLSIPLDHVAFDLRGGAPIGITLDPRLDDDARRWRIALFRPCAGYRVAVAIAGMVPLDVHTVSEVPLEPPTKIDLGMLGSTELPYDGDAGAVD